MNWKSVIKYATLLFLAHFILGFFEGLFFEPSVSVVFSLHAASLVVCGAIFLHLGMHLSFKPFVHAWAAFVLEIFLAWALIFLIYRWFGGPNIMEVIIEYVVGVFALVAGTSFGVILRHRINPKGKV